MTVAAGALEDVKVADFSQVGTGPATARILATHGATVVKVESGEQPDLARLAPPMKDSIPGLNRAGWFNELNCNKLGMTLNLKNKDGLAIARRLAGWADVVIENFTPGVFERLGLGYAALRAINPRVILFSTSIQGAGGPHSGHPGFGVTLAGLTGIAHLTGWPDRGPVEVYGAYPDWLLPPFGASAILAALARRHQTGEGMHIEASQFEVALNFLGPVLLDYTVNGRVWERRGNLDSAAAPHNVYPCRGEDQWCAIAVTDDAEWEALVGAVAVPGLDDPRFSTADGRKQHETVIDGLLSAWTRGRSADEIVGPLQAAGVPAGFVQRGQDLRDDPQLAHRRHWHVREHAEIGTCTLSANPYTLSETPAEIRHAGPLFGQDTERVCLEILGLSREETAALRVAGAFS
jgi:crotonobetainyl-CoA:carnitine CoA-transferase CaiB-like acyl-CoA transferase